MEKQPKQGALSTTVGNELVSLENSLEDKFGVIPQRNQRVYTLTLLSHGAFIPSTSSQTHLPRHRGIQASGAPRQRDVKTGIWKCI